jgi:hypothetical protein
MKKIILLIFSVVGIALLQSCQYEWLDPIDAVIPETVSFSVNIIPIFDRGCNSASCHAPGGIAPDLTPANAYIDLFALNLIDTVNPMQSIIYKKMAEGGSMNKYTKPGDADMVEDWIQQGALNN